MRNELINNVKSHNNDVEMDIYYNAENYVSSSLNKYIQDMYEEFKKCFEQRNFVQIDRIIKNIINVDSESNILNSIYGQISLFRGDGNAAYRYLLKYAQNHNSVDIWALRAMSLWNLFSGNYSLALKQFSEVLSGKLPTMSLIFIMINAAKTKKMLGFYDRAFSYLERLQTIPDGYKMILLIKLEIIHIYILKKDYNSALNEIDIYLQLGSNCYVRRLKVYILYLQKKYMNILSLIDEQATDPYITYIIARVGMDNQDFTNIDVVYYFEEAIRISRGNKYIHNTFGNYYSSINKFSEAAEQYNYALCIDPDFFAAKSNLNAFNRININKSVVDSEDINISGILEDVDPDVEELGFLDTWRMMGYSFFRPNNVRKNQLVSLKFYCN